MNNTEIAKPEDFVLPEILGRIEIVPSVRALTQGLGEISAEFPEIFALNKPNPFISRSIGHSVTIALNQRTLDLLQTNNLPTYYTENGILIHHDLADFRYAGYEIEQRAYFREEPNKNPLINFFDTHLSPTKSKYFAGKSLFGDNLYYIPDWKERFLTNVRAHLTEMNKKLARPGTNLSK